MQSVHSRLGVQVVPAKELSTEPCADAVRTDFVGENRREFERDRDAESWLQQLLPMTR